MLEREVIDRGGAYAFCDTDSMAVLTDYSGLEQITQVSATASVSGGQSASQPVLLQLRSKGNR